MVVLHKNFSLSCFELGLRESGCTLLTAGSDAEVTTTARAPEPAGAEVQGAAAGRHGPRSGTALTIPLAHVATTWAKADERLFGALARAPLSLHLVCGQQRAPAAHAGLRGEGGKAGHWMLFCRFSHCFCQQDAH